MSNDHSEKLLRVLTKMSENQKALEDKMNALTENVTTVQNGQNDNQNHYNIYRNNRGRGNYRERNNNSRGKRGGYYKKIRVMDDKEIITIDGIIEAEVIGEGTIEEITPIITFRTIFTNISIVLFVTDKAL